MSNRTLSLGFNLKVASIGYKFSEKIFAANRGFQNLRGFLKQILFF
jgi:hypothetical protein